MRNQQLSKYSIKSTLQQLLIKNPTASLPEHTPSAMPQTFISSDNNFGSDRLLIMPQYHNYFLHTIEKEIKHEGSLLKRIRKKIDDFKEQQIEKKKIKNSRHYHSHLMFATRQSRSRTKNGTAFNTTTPTPCSEMHRTVLCPTPTSARYTCKNKTNSFSRQSADAKRVKNANGVRQIAPIQGCGTFVPARSSFYTENELMQKFGKLVKHKNTKKVKNMDENVFSVMGGRPQWSTFQSYRCNHVKTDKKML